ncbi:hypothetical protein F5050DRAFT_1807507 [Lentinula boryana]|uniref:Aprataxin and PNK-like factor PBZ domain-containing protein n=1 Tax=Lentinula boryana TaxID=40481 RepID=A0ABQ8QE31_9AGAR|nr:hypothetical protein F5050DRAFT_1807507 [Lentinula boryana]
MSASDYNENGLPVSDDIIDIMLLFSPTFSSLQATILTCKQFYRVFQVHPKSVIRAVAYNITGPALPQALECIRHPDIQKHPHKLSSGAYWGDFDEDSEDDDSKDEDSDENSGKEDKKEPNTQLKQINARTGDIDSDIEDLSLAPITALETHEILANSKVVARLEDLFSFRYLDRSASTSQLSWSESQAFCVAMYHLMLYSSIFHPGTWNLSSDSENDENADVGEHRENFEKRKKHLSRLSTSELLQLHSVAEFLKEILLWCVRTSGYPSEICDLALAAGPVRILKCFDNQDNSPLQPLEDILDYFEEELELHPRLAGLLSGPHLKNLEARNVKPPPLDFTHWLSISPRVTERNSQCDRCQRSFGFDTFSRSTFTELSNGEHLRLHTTSLSYYDSKNISRCLKNHLRYNYAESKCFSHEAEKFGASLLLQIWNDLWNLRTVIQLPKDQQNLPDWTEDDYLCEDCFRSFLFENLWLWWRHVKSGSEPLKDNCWYGYNCRTQTHNSTHAQKLNHLCEQTRF